MNTLFNTFTPKSASDSVVLKTAPNFNAGKNHSDSKSSNGEDVSNVSPKQKYRELCNNETSIHLFARDWWLDATVGNEEWDVAVVEKSGKIVAALPYRLQTKIGFKVLSQPALTPSLGPWLAVPKGKDEISLSQQKELMTGLIDNLPKFDHFLQIWNYRYTNWLPFYWKGFTQTTGYTYVLKDIQDPHKLMSNFQHHVRKEINKASKRFQLQVRDDLPIDALLELNRKTFGRQGKSLPYSEEYVRRIDAACAAHNCRRLFIAVDPSGRHHAAVYIVWDETTAYYLIGGGDPDLRTSGAASLCMWAAINYASKVTRQFDFEGSMIEPIERFFRDFGGDQVPYFTLKKTPSRILRARESLLSVLGRA